MINLEKKLNKKVPATPPSKKTCSCAIPPLFLIFQAPPSGGGNQNLLPKGGERGRGPTYDRSVSILYTFSFQSYQ